MALERVTVRGPLVLDTSVPGDRKADGVTPNNSTCIRLSKDRWLLMFSTVDPRGWDATRSIIVQLRAGAPGGDLVREKAIVTPRSDWDPFGTGLRLWKSHGAPVAFGVPKGAILDEKRTPNENLFLLKWYVRGHLEEDGRLLGSNLVEDENLKGELAQTMQLEYTHFRLNDAEDDIEILDPPRRLCEKGYESETAFCRFGEGCRMAQTSPLRSDTTGREWVEIADPGDFLAPVKYAFNPSAERYEWVDCGPKCRIPDCKIGEACPNIIAGEWIIAVRCFNRGGDTAWYRTPDPFRGLGEPKFVKATYGTRRAFVCADGGLRIWKNDRNLSPHHDRRNPLYGWKVDPETLDYSEQHTVLDARQSGMPFENPFIDTPYLVEHGGGRRQTLLFRCITARQTACGEDAGAITEGAMAVSGVYRAELEYDRDYPSAWTFAE